MFSGKTLLLIRTAIRMTTEQPLHLSTFAAPVTKCVNSLENFPLNSLVITGTCGGLMHYTLPFGHHSSLASLNFMSSHC